MSQAMPTILIVDDDPEVRRVLCQALAEDHFTVLDASDKARALHHIRHNHVDLITLDLRLDNENGLEFAREMRALHNTPVVIITGLGGSPDRIAGLEYGADDYIIKPFHVREVLLRIRNVLKRYDHRLVERKSAAGHSHYEFDHCVIDTETRELRRANGDVVALTDFEYRLLLLLVQNAARVVSREEICRALMGHEWSPLDRTVDGHIARLRRKLEQSVDEPRLIKSVRGVGYVFASRVLHYSQSDEQQHETQEVTNRRA